MIKVISYFSFPTSLFIYQSLSDFIIIINSCSIEFIEFFQSWYLFFCYFIYCSSDVSYYF
nr:MAG TPA: hypothetical protein [Caudoviricetes sp.]